PVRQPGLRGRGTQRGAPGAAALAGGEDQGAEFQGAEFVSAPETQEPDRPTELGVAERASGRFQSVCPPPRFNTLPRPSLLAIIRRFPFAPGEMTIPKGTSRQSGRLANHALLRPARLTPEDVRLRSLAELVAA